MRLLCQPMMAWEALQVNADSVSSTVQSAAQAVSLLREASHALAVLEEVQAAQQQSLRQHQAPDGTQQQQRQQQQGQQQAGQQQEQQQEVGPLPPQAVQAVSTTSRNDESAGPHTASTSAQDASDRVEAAFMWLLLSQRQGKKEQERAFHHLRMVLETYVSCDSRA